MKGIGNYAIGAGPGPVFRASRFASSGLFARPVSLPARKNQGKRPAAGPVGEVTAIRYIAYTLHALSPGAKRLNVMNGSRLMTVTIELKPEIEAGLAALAAAHGLALPQYVQRVLENQVTPGRATMSPAERAAAWRASTAGLPLRPPLSDEAISRASIYDSRG
jgi:hypothetical protein